MMRYSIPEEASVRLAHATNIQKNTVFRQLRGFLADQLSSTATVEITEVGQRRLDKVHATTVWMAA
jgi:hypothetical protein